MKNLFEYLISGDRKALAQAITLVESSLPSHRTEAEKLIEKIVEQPTKSIRVAISGIPGVGKSSFIEALGIFLVEKCNKKIAVLAVDPSSPLSGGSLLGDKTRMHKLSRSKDAFVRPSPNNQMLGGVGLKTRESILLCEASGFDVILVETVGVGQSETQARAMVDFFATFLLPETGDQLQGLKKGIIEISDIICINKSDEDNLQKARQTAIEYKTALGFQNKQKIPQKQVLETSSFRPETAELFWHTIEKMEHEVKKNGLWAKNRELQKSQWLKDTLLYHYQKKAVEEWAKIKDDNFSTPYKFTRQK